MDDVAVLSLFRFTPVRTAFDSVLRDQTIPRLCARSGLLDVYAGRQGPADLGPRIIASVWESRAASSAGLGDPATDPTFDPELPSATTDRTSLVMPIRARVRGRRADAAEILRIAQGQVRAGEIDAYVADVQAGTTRDIAAGEGPLALFLATADGDRFVTFSVWGGWPEIERATGSDVRRPIATRQPERIVDWSVEYFECLPDLPRPSAADG